MPPLLPPYFNEFPTQRESINLKTSTDSYHKFKLKNRKSTTHFETLKPYCLLKNSFFNI